MIKIYIFKAANLLETNEIGIDFSWSDFSEYKDILSLNFTKIKYLDAENDFISLVSDEQFKKFKEYVLGERLNDNRVIILVYNDIFDKEKWQLLIDNIANIRELGQALKRNVSLEEYEGTNTPEQETKDEVIPLYGNVALDVSKNGNTSAGFAQDEYVHRQPNSSLFATPEGDSEMNISRSVESYVWLFQKGVKEYFYRGTVNESEIATFVEHCLEDKTCRQNVAGLVAKLAVQAEQLFSPRAFAIAILWSLCRKP